MGAALQAEDDDIAIVGFSVKLPGGVNDADSLWTLLSDGKNASSPWPESLLSVGSVKSTRHYQVKCRGGHFLDEDTSTFDAPFFSITAKEAAAMDPVQRLTLEAAYLAFENAGIPVASLRESRTAVFSACTSDDYGRAVAQDPEDHARSAVTGTFASTIPNRVSWFFDLVGPSVFVDSACSSGLLAVDLACQAMRGGDATAALVTGANLVLTAGGYQLLSAQGFLSPDSRCYSFDHRANGYARGEGVVAVVLKPLRDALRDGDVVRAVVRSSATNQDGHTPGLTQPNPTSQERLIRHVYAKAGLPLDRTRYVEAHGTGTPVGDPIEMKALGRTFGASRSADAPLYVGSVKANAGHLEGGSGLAGLLKAVMVLERGVIPPQANFEKINPSIDAAAFHLEVPTALVPWPSQGLRRVSVNSFGFGGTNTHVVVDDALHYLEEKGLAGHHKTLRQPDAGSGRNHIQNGHHRVNGHLANGHHVNGHQTNGHNHQNGNHLSNGHRPSNGHAEGGNGVAATTVNGNSVSATNGRPRLLVWSAADQQALGRMSKQYEALHRDVTSGDARRLDQLAFTLASRRSLMLWRRFAIVNPAPADGARASLLSGASEAIRSAEASELGLAFVFTGQGAQYADMGLGLLRYPVFERTLRSCDAAFRDLGCEWPVLAGLRDGATIDSPDHSQPLSTALQIALVDLLASFGVVPKAVVGHSSGEIAAAYATGALSLRSACRVSYLRGKLAARLRGDLAAAGSPGAMMAVNLAERDVAAYLAKTDGGGATAGAGDDGINVACVNSPGNVTLAGREAAIDALKMRLDADGIFAQKLNTGVAYHSPDMARVADAYLAEMGVLEGRRAGGTTGRGAGTGLKSGNPRGSVPMVSSVTGKPVRPRELARPQYWVDNMVSPVRFSDAVTVLAQQTSSLKIGIGSITDLVEVGAHAALRRPVLDTLKAAAESSSRVRNNVVKKKQIRYASVLHRSRPADETVLELGGQLFGLGHPVSVQAVNGLPDDGQTPLADLPGYPFDHSRRYWSESRLSRDLRLREAVRGDMLGARFFDWNPLEPRWRAFWSVESMPWTGDHVVSGTVILPGAAMLVMAVEAVAQTVPAGREVAGFYLREAHFMSPIVVGQAWEDRTETMVQLRPSRRTANARAPYVAADVTIYSYSYGYSHGCSSSGGTGGGQWTECFRASVAAQYAGVDEASHVLDERRIADDDVAGRFETAAAACSLPIDSRMFYDDAAQHGLRWGADYFQMLDAIGWDGEGRAIGQAPLLPRYRTESLVHPALLDAAFQTLRVSTTRGLALSATSTNIPVRLEDGWFAATPKWQGPEDGAVRFLADSLPDPDADDDGSSSSSNMAQTRGAIHALAADGTVLCSISRLVMASVSSEANAGGGGDAEAGAGTVAGSARVDKKRRLVHRVEWRPQLSLLDGARLSVECDADAMPPGRDEAKVVLRSDKMRRVMIEAVARVLAKVGTGELVVPHDQETLRRHVEWMATLDIPPAAAAGGMSDDEMEAELREIETTHPPWRMYCALVREIQPILRGAALAHEVIFGHDNNLATPYYADFCDQVCDRRLYRLLDLAAHETPGLRVLEIGAGTGSFTGHIVHGLLEAERRTGTRRFAEYAYTDVTAAFFDAAERRWAAEQAAGGGSVADRMRFKTFDMDRPVEEQGFAAGGYDLVVAGSVLHATEDLMRVMANVRTLLRPGGMLVLFEVVSTADLAMNFTFGLMPGWWGGRREKWRGACPCVADATWDVVLRGSGFAGNEMVLRETARDDLHLFSIIASRAVAEEPKLDGSAPPSSPPALPRLTLVVRDGQDARQMELARLVRSSASRRHETAVVELAHAARSAGSEDDIVICLAEMYRPLLADICASDFEAVQELVKRNRRILWVAGTGENAQDQDDSLPQFSVAKGFLRTLRSEDVRKQLVTLSIEPRVGEGAAAHAAYVSQVLDAAMNSATTSAAPPASGECEYVAAGGRLTTGRLAADVARNGALNALLRPTMRERPWLDPDGSGPALKVSIGADRTLESLTYTEDEDRRELGEREVEIEARAWAVNFRDVLVALGRIDDTTGLGADCSGIVRRVGARCDPDGPKVGDRVAAVTPPCMRTFPRAPEQAVVRIPDSTSFEDAAAALIPGMTALYGLVDVGRVRSGDKVLVHAAAGSTGQMAVWIAKARGAEVFATTSSDEKRALLRSMGVADDHIFYSRDTSFATALKRATRGRGVDIVLNSLSGDSLLASWGCLAPFGRFVEIGKADILANSPLPMGRFADNVSFAAVDLRQICRACPDLTGRLLRDVLAMLAAGTMKPPGVTVFPASRLEDAFRHMQAGKALGRVMVRLDRAEVVPQLLLDRRDWRLPADAAYLVAGGTGGIGRSIARWLA